MNKKLLLMCLVGLMSAIPTYAACNGGTQVTGTSGTFCKSNVKMNWWSAAAWCKANGRRLATMYEICPSWNGNINVVCSELKGQGNGYIWTATASSREYVFTLILSTGEVTNYDARDSHNSYAFCR